MTTNISEERKDRFISNVRRLAAYQAIQNMAGRCVAAFNFRRMEAFLEFFALDKADVSFEFADEGVFVGAQAVQAIVRDTVGKAPQPGEMIDLQLTTPMIEVAGDMQTARALWWSPGAGAVLREGDDPEAVWYWGNIAVDLVNENGEWKIWHLHYFTLIKCDYQKGWVEDTSMINRPNTAMHKSARPCTYHNPYSPLHVRDGIPACPRPYETWTDDNWMLRTDKTK